MKRILFLIVGLIAVILISVTLYFKCITLEPSLSSSYDFEDMGASEITGIGSEAEWDEYIKAFNGQPYESEENPYKLDEEIVKYSSVEFIGSYTKKSDVVKCRITAPNIHDYIMENEDQLLQLDTEEIYSQLINYVQESNFQMMTTDLDLTATYINKQLVVSSESFEFQDAIHGGLYSAMTEIYIQAFNEMIEFNEEK